MGAGILICAGVGFGPAASVVRWFFKPREGSVAWFKTHERERSSLITKCFLAPDFADKRVMNCENAEKVDRELKSEAIDEEMKSMGRSAR